MFSRSPTRRVAASMWVAVLMVCSGVVMGVLTSDGVAVLRCAVAFSYTPDLVDVSSTLLSVPTIDPSPGPRPLPSRRCKKSADGNHQRSFSGLPDYLGT